MRSLSASRMPPKGMLCYRLWDHDSEHQQRIDATGCLSMRRLRRSRFVPMPSGLMQVQGTRITTRAGPVPGLSQSLFFWWRSEFGWLNLVLPIRSCCHTSSLERSCAPDFLCQFWYGLGRSVPHFLKYHEPAVIYNWMGDFMENMGPLHQQPPPIDPPTQFKNKELYRAWVSGLGAEKTAT